MGLVSIADLNQPVEDLQPYIDLARTLGVLYDDLLEGWQESSIARAPGLHASEISKCVRQATYSLMGTQKHQETKAKMRRKFHIGHLIHAMVQKELHLLAAKHQAEDLARRKGWFLEFEDEVVISPKHQTLAAQYQFYSSCDGVFTFREAEHAEPILRVGLEIKTEMPDSYEELKKPKDDHVKQAHIYMACLDLPLLWFFYMNKGNQNTTDSQTPWLIPFDSKIWSDLESRSRVALDSATASMVPPREEGFHCTFCPYAWECKPPSQQRRDTRHISVRRSTP